MPRNTRRQVCFECGESAAKHPDPRIPPLELGEEVLCTDCYTGSLNDLIEEHNEKIEKLTGILDTLP